MADWCWESPPYLPQWTPDTEMMIKEIHDGRRQGSQSNKTILYSKPWHSKIALKTQGRVWGFYLLVVFKQWQFKFLLSFSPILPMPIVLEVVFSLTTVKSDAYKLERMREGVNTAQWGSLIRGSMKHTYYGYTLKGPA